MSRDYLGAGQRGGRGKGSTSSDRSAAARPPTRALGARGYFRYFVLFSLRQGPWWRVGECYTHSAYKLHVSARETKPRHAATATGATARAATIYSAALFLAFFLPSLFLLFFLASLPAGSSATLFLLDGGATMSSPTRPMAAFLKRCPGT